MIRDFFTTPLTFTEGVFLVWCTALGALVGIAAAVYL